MRTRRINDEERRLWVLNDEGLYLWWQSEGGSIRKFIAKHRNMIDAVILEQLNKKPRS